MWEIDDLFGSDLQPWTRGLHAGVDEVGIGPLAGPVYAAAVLLDPAQPIDGLNDSKVLTTKKRETLAQAIQEKAQSWAIAAASVAEIDQLNILRASHLAMQRAVSALSQVPHMVYVDGNKAPHMNVPVVAVVQGDRRVPQISAASIIAKVARDQEMERLDGLYPGYGLAKHKGYPTKKHFDALQDLGASAIHRRSFAPVRAVLEPVA